MEPAIFSKHEVHCTFSANRREDFDYFRQECRSGGIKIIDVNNGFPKVSTDVMTSTVCHSQGAAFRLMDDLDYVANKTNGNIIRKKIEVQPKITGDTVDNNEYFELHVNIRALDLNAVKFDREKWFVSQNIYKPLLADIPLWMLTARSYRTTIEQFYQSCLESMESFKSVIDRRERFFVEKCIYDTNAELDESWMKPKGKL